jgi:hypothetical protein
VKNTLLLVSIALTLVACDNDGASNSLGTTAPESTELATELDEKFLAQIKKTMDVVEQQKLWPGYDYKAVPQYFIHAENDKPITAFVVNPQSDIDKAQKLGMNESQGLNVAKLEDGMFSAFDKINSGNGIYDFDYKIDEKNYYIQRYSESDVKIKDPLVTSAFTMAVHEVFHSYQEDNFKNPIGYFQLDFNKFNQYPITNELLVLQLTLMDVLKNNPRNNMNKDNAISMLEKYFVIVDTMLKLDPTTSGNVQSGWIYKHGLGQELFEGSAQYIDLMATRRVLPITSDKKFIYTNPFLMDEKTDGYAKLTSKKDVIDYFAFQVFYFTGSNAIWLLNQAGYDIKNLEKGIYPYDAAKELLKLSEMEEIEILSNLKQSDIWSQAEIAALRYSKLK